MIDFSAFPVRKTNHYLWIKIPSGLAVLSLLVSFVFISRPTAAERELGLSIFQITVSVIIAILSISLLVISIWFIKFIISRFINIVTEGYGARVPAHDTISSFEQFALNNGYEFFQYPFQSHAPLGYYEGLINKSDQDDIYVLYQIKGIYVGSEFTLYCLASAEGRMPIPGSSERRGMAYAHDTDGRRIEYITVLSTPIHTSRKRIGVIKVLHKRTSSLIWCHGYISDRNLLEKMFSMIGSNR